MLLGCTVGPDYVPPTYPMPGAWSESLEGGLAAEPADLQEWWLTFEDPGLNSLIERALAGNLDLKGAVARIREARAQRGFVASDRFPTIDAAGSYSRDRASENVDRGFGNNIEVSDTDLFSFGFDASWELDIFGRVRRSVEAANANLDAAGEDYRDVLVTLLSEVALNYVEVRSFQTRLEIAEANVRVQEDTLKLTQARFNAGLTSGLDVAQAEANLDTTRSAIPTLQIGLKQAMNRLGVLLGQNPGSLSAELSKPMPIPVTPTEVAIGIPADLLRRRPDIRRAERELAAQTARIGVATADLYPRFSLLGSIGLEASDFGSLFELGSRAYSVGPSFQWNIFDAGRIRSNIVIQDARQEQALIRYESAVLTALEDVENALVAYAREQVRRQSLLKAVDASQRAVKLAETLYIQGLSDFQNVLDAQRSLFNLQDQLAESEGAVTSNLISLYKALGGGWEVPDDATSSSAKL
jgi:NodT family efflux transporter outer membrane factor (OMF) lipoprotein